ncbi:MAG: peptidoglycan DD-metalloendopeptidase family protein, partial [Tenericutes bacterium]|nr:peptidoglycan DD-metalloendopeptidase family protein [Mycoplasmatota bacterium]
MFRKKQEDEEKYSVGRPKLADTKLKRESIIVSAVVLFAGILLAAFGGLDLTTMIGNNTANLSGNVATDKLNGAIHQSMKNSQARWDWVHMNVNVPMEMSCTASNDWYLRSITGGGTQVYSGKAHCPKSGKNSVTVKIPISMVSSGGKITFQLNYQKIVKGVVKSQNSEKESLSFKSFNKPSISVSGSYNKSKTVYTAKVTYKYDGTYLKPYFISNGAGCSLKSGSASSSSTATSTYTYTCTKKGSSYPALVTKSGNYVANNGRAKATINASGIVGATAKKTTKKAQVKKTTKKKTTTPGKNMKISCSGTQKVGSTITCTVTNINFQNRSASYTVKPSKGSCSKGTSGSNKIKLSCNSAGTVTITAKYGSNKVSKKLTIASKSATTKKKSVKKTTKKATKKTTKKKSTKKCTPSITSITASSATYKIKCTGKTASVKSVSITNGGKIAKPTANKKSKLLTGKITKLSANKKYKVTIKLTDGTTLPSKTFTTKKNSMTEAKLKKLPKGNCPVAPTVTLNKTGSVKIATNIGALTAAEKKNLYIVTKSYKVSTNKYTYGNGKTGTDNKYGSFNSANIVNISTKWTKDKKDTNKLYKSYNTGDYYYTAIWSGSKKCYVNYFVKDGVTLDNATRNYILSRYNIITKDKIIRASLAGTTVTSTDEKVFKVSKALTKTSYKATSKTAKNGHEAAAKKTAKLTFKNSLGTGSFKLMLRNKYWETAYLLNPLTGKNTKITSSSVYSGDYKKYGKAKHTKKDGKTVNGLELKTSANKKVYVMDSGTVSLIKTTSNSKNTGKTIYITSTINGHKYIHVYSNLKSISVKKGERVYKGQKIATTKKGFLYVTINFVNPDNNKSVGMLASNFIGQDRSYAIGSVSMAKVCRKLTDKCGSELTTEDSGPSTITKGSVTSSSSETTTETTEEVTEPDDITDPTDPDGDNTNSTTTKTTTTTPSGENKTCPFNYNDRKIGDVNCDEKVTNSDVVRLNYHIVGLKPISS